MNLYLIPGMGADHRLFSKLDLQPHTVHLLDWVPAGDEMTISDYASLMLDRVKTENDNVFIGVSMGGIVALEMAKISRPRAVVLISAPAASREFSNLLKWGRHLHIDKWISARMLKKLSAVFEVAMQFQSREGKILFREMLKSCDEDFLKWSIGAVLNWESVEKPKKFIQLVGDKDIVFPLWKMNAPVVVPNAGHLAVFESAENVSVHIRRYLMALTSVEH